MENHNTNEIAEYNVLNESNDYSFSIRCKKKFAWFLHHLIILTLSYITVSLKTDI